MNDAGEAATPPGNKEKTSDNGQARKQQKDYSTIQPRTVLKYYSTYA